MEDEMSVTCIIPGLCAIALYGNLNASFPNYIDVSDSQIDSYETTSDTDIIIYNCTPDSILMGTLKVAAVLLSASDIDCSDIYFNQNRPNKYQSRLSSTEARYRKSRYYRTLRTVTEALFDEVDDWLGTPYIYGGESKEGADCSGFIQSLFYSLGYDIPRTASTQMEFCKIVSIGNARAGDLLFFDTDNNGRVNASHVGVYMGDDQFAHSLVRNANQGVVNYSIDSFNGFYLNKLIAVGRIFLTVSEQ